MTSRDEWLQNGFFSLCVLVFQDRIFFFDPQYVFVVDVVCCVIVFLEIAFLYVTLAVLELVMEARLALNSQDPPASCLLSAGIKSGPNLAQPRYFLCFIIEY